MPVVLRLLFFILMTLMLSILPLPDVVAQFRPPWVLLWIMALQFFYPKYFHLVFLVILGLCLDVLLTTVTGEHSFALMLTMWIASNKTRRFRYYTQSQQMGLVGIFCLIYESILFLIDAFSGYPVHPLNIIFPALSALLFWPFIVFLAHTALQVRPNKNRLRYANYIK